VQLCSLDVTARAGDSVPNIETPLLLMDLDKFCQDVQRPGTGSHDSEVQVRSLEVRLRRRLIESHRACAEMQATQFSALRIGSSTSFMKAAPTAATPSPGLAWCHGDSEEQRSTTQLSGSLHCAPLESISKLMSE
jgi:hypothetical protein